MERFNLENDGPTIVITKHGSSYSYGRLIFSCETGPQQGRIVIAVLDDEVRNCLFSPRTRRLWIKTDSDDIFFIEYIEDDGDAETVSPLPGLRLPVHIDGWKRCQFIQRHQRVPEYIVFISHSGPDKETIAIPLARLLEDVGIKCFLDQLDLHTGVLAPRKMDAAASSAPVGVFVLSPEFRNRNWSIGNWSAF